MSRDTAIEVRVDQEEKTAIQAWAARQKMSLSEATRRLWVLAVAQSVDLAAMEKLLSVCEDLGALRSDLDSLRTQVKKMTKRLTALAAVPGQKSKGR